MNIKQNKILNRISLVFTNSLASIAVPAVNMAFSLVVVKTFGAEKWGEFVYYFLWASLASFVMNWGNRDYLLKEFAKQPLVIPQLWREFFFTRSLLIVPCIAVFAALFSFREAFLLGVWTMLLFVAQSFDVLTAYRRKFLRSFFIEISAGVFLIIAMVFISGFGILKVYIAYLCLRVFLYFVLFRADAFTDFSIKFNFSLLKKSVLFFILGLTGLIGSRVDQYCVSLMLPKEELGKYNILKSFLLYFQAMSGFIVLPFVKDVFRMQNESVKKLANNLFIIGLASTPFFIAILYIIINFFYGFSFSIDIYIYGAVFIPTVYYYSVTVYKMIKDERVSAVIVITLIGITVAAVLNIILIPPLEIKGGMIASSVSAVLTAVMYYFYNRKLSAA